MRKINPGISSQPQPGDLCRNVTFSGLCMLQEKSRAIFSRRFRTETLRRAICPQDLTKLWLGHSKETETDFWPPGSAQRFAWRCDWAEKIGTRFSLLRATWGYNVVQINVKVA